MANEKQQKVKISSKRKDINFFALKKVQRKGLDISIPPWVISILVPSLVVAVIASVYIYNQSTISRLENELAASELQIEHANVDKQRPYMAKKTVEKDIFSTYYQWITHLNSQFENFKTVQSEIPNSITNKANGLVTIASFAAKDEKITIKGSGDTMSAIADFQRSCMDIPDIETAFVSNMQKTTITVENPVLPEFPDTKEVYTFNFTATFKARNSMMKEASE